MRTWNRLWLTGALAMTVPLGIPARAGAAALTVTPPQIAVQEYRLGNGMQVLLQENHTVPAVAVEVWYHVGSKNERKGRSGFAHLFEHLMFKGSENLGPEEHKNFISAIGGRYNATTDFDRTLYFEVFPSNYLERVLCMEADRMRSLDVSEANFHSERDVVKEERRLRVDNPPFGRLFEVVLANTFTTHPYKILSIGSIADLDAATIEDVRDFHRIYYVPNNASLVISGDFEPAQAKSWIEKYFGPISKGQAIPREILQEPAQTAERRVTDRDSRTPLPAVILAFHGPREADKDTYALEVASNILSSGQSSRLYRKMVYEQQSAIAAGGQSFLLEDPGIFYFFTILQQCHTAEEGEKSLQEEIERLKTQPVSTAELEKSKNQLISGLVFGRETDFDRADAIGHAAVILGDWRLVNSQLAEYQKVTAADVQAVAAKYFRPENRTVVYMLPEAAKKEGKP